MKLVRFGSIGNERPGVLGVNGSIRDISSLVEDITPEIIGGSLLDKLANFNIDSLPIVEQPQRLGPPLKSVSKFIAIGLNYRDHAEESNMKIPEEPIVFMKAPSCLSGPFDPIILPKGSTRTDWEVELGIVIGRVCRYVELSNALTYVAGYLIVHDVSEREYQLDRGGQWDKGKGCDSFGPIGPWLVTRDEIPDPQQLDLWLDVNGRQMQRGNSRTMIFDCATLVSYVSQFMTLMPGDIITTGTPPGVGMGRTPPSYLRAGDVVRLGISGLGVQRQEVQAYPGDNFNLT